MKIIGRIIWELLEFFDISVGKYDPIILGWMLGSRPILKNKKEN